MVQGGWSVRTSLPRALCDVALVVAAIGCRWPSWVVGVELTYFWGLTGTLQAVITPDLSAGSGTAGRCCRWERRRFLVPQGRPG